MTVNVETHGGNAVTGGEFTCVVCPAGCFIEVEFTNDHPPKLKSFTGSRCEKGDAWIKQEI